MSTIAGQTIQAQMILRCLRRTLRAWKVCTQWLLCHHPPEGTSNVSIRINLHWGFLFVCQSIIIIPSCRWQIQAPSHLLYKSLFTSCWIVNIVFLLEKEALYNVQRVSKTCNSAWNGKYSAISLTSRCWNTTFSLGWKARNLFYFPRSIWISCTIQYQEG